MFTIEWTTAGREMNDDEILEHPILQASLRFLVHFSGLHESRSHQKQS